MWQMGEVFKEWEVIIPLPPAASEEEEEACAKLTDEISGLLESFDREVLSRISIIIKMVIKRVRRQCMIDFYLPHEIIAST